MSDTTAYLAGCATTGVAALVLLVARVGMVSANPDADRASQLGDRLDRIEAAATPDAGAIADTQSTQKLDYEIRRELDKQRDLTQKLEDQLTQQETLSGSLETQLKSQEEKTQELLAKIQDYQRSVENLELQDKITAAARPADTAPSPSGPSASVIWLGAGVVVVLILGGGGLILCAVLLIVQSQRRSARHAPMPTPVPMPPAGYRYYDQTFLPPAQFRAQRSYYDQPPSPYDYNR